MTDSAESWKFMLYHTNSLQLCQTAGIQKAGESVVSTENAQASLIHKPTKTQQPLPNFQLATASYLLTLQKALLSLLGSLV